MRSLHTLLTHSIYSCVRVWVHFYAFLNSVRVRSSALQLYACIKSLCVFACVCMCDSKICDAFLSSFVRSIRQNMHICIHILYMIGHPQCGTVYDMCTLYIQPTRCFFILLLYYGFFTTVYIFEFHGKRRNYSLPKI